MNYIGQKDYSHNTKPRVAVLLTNLGTPASPTTKDLRVYLKEFLSDPRVVEVPRLLWFLILNLIILRIRPKKSAKLYKSIWTEMGSPLMSNTIKQKDMLEEKFKLLDKSIIIDFAMRYGKPTIKEKLHTLQNTGADKILILPLYPQYSGATSGSTFDAVSKVFSKTRWVPNIRFISSYHDHKDYIDACVQQINSFWTNNSKPEKLVLSYHGVPKKYLTKGDPYYCHCQKTSRLISEHLDFNKENIITTFQSRFGNEEWLKPYTDETLKQLGNDGVSSINVFCPGFSSDCLETLEEIAVENKNYFIESGGASYNYIPALNSESAHIESLYSLILKNITDWI